MASAAAWIEHALEDMRLTLVPRNISRGPSFSDDRKRTRQKEQSANEYDSSQAPQHGVTSSAF